MMLVKSLLASFRIMLCIAAIVLLCPFCSYCMFVVHKPEPEWT